MVLPHFPKLLCILRDVAGCPSTGQPGTQHPPAGHLRAHPLQTLGKSNPQSWSSRQDWIRLRFGNLQAGHLDSSSHTQTPTHLLKPPPFLKPTLTFGQALHGISVTTGGRPVPGELDMPVCGSRSRPPLPSPQGGPHFRPHQMLFP